LSYLRLYIVLLIKKGATMTTREDFKTTLKKNGITLSEFANIMNIDITTISKKQTVDKIYIDALGMIIENEKLKKKIIEFNGEIVEKLKGIK
jgi:hypothetical protein